MLARQWCKAPGDLEKLNFYKKILIISISRLIFRFSPAGVEIIPDQVIFQFFHQAADLSKFRGYNRPEGCGNLMLLHYHNRTEKKIFLLPIFLRGSGCDG